MRIRVGRRIRGIGSECVLLPIHIGFAVCVSFPIFIVSLIVSVFSKTWGDLIEKRLSEANDRITTFRFRMAGDPDGADPAVRRRRRIEKMINRG